MEWWITDIFESEECMSMSFDLCCCIFSLPSFWLFCFEGRGKFLDFLFDIFWKVEGGQVLCLPFCFFVWRVKGVSFLFAFLEGRRQVV